MRIPFNRVLQYTPSPPMLTFRVVHVHVARLTLMVGNETIFFQSSPRKSRSTKLFLFNYEAINSIDGSNEAINLEYEEYFPNCILECHLFSQAPYNTIPTPASKGSPPPIDCPVSA